MVAALHRLGSADGLGIRWGDLHEWLAETPTDDVLVALVRVLALGLAWWLLVSTTLYLAANVLHLPGGLVRSVRRATLPGVRRLVDGIVAGSVVAGSTFAATGPALAQPAAPAAANSYVPRAAGDVPAYTPVPAGDGAPVTTTATTATPDPAAPPGQLRPGPTPIHRVERGDNLWSIAERHLARSTGRPTGDLSDDDIRLCWLRLVEENRGRLASGDPDLIYPGDELMLPDVNRNP